jgi:hypothetical protein
MDAASRCATVLGLPGNPRRYALSHLHLGVLRAPQQVGSRPRTSDSSAGGERGNGGGVQAPPRAHARSGAFEMAGGCRRVSGDAGRRRLAVEPGCAVSLSVGAARWRSKSQVARPSPMVQTWPSGTTSAESDEAGCVDQIVPRRSCRRAASRQRVERPSGCHDWLGPAECVSHPFGPSHRSLERISPAPRLRTQPAFPA